MASMLSRWKHITSRQSNIPPGLRPTNALGFMLAALIVAVIAAQHVTGPSYQWPDITRQGPAQPHSPPAWLDNTQEPTLLWRPAGAESLLSYQALAPAAETHAILPYPDVDPCHWQASGAGPGRYHVVWLETDGRLRSALLASNGETLRGPIELTPAARPDFALLPLPDNGALAIWVDDPAGHLVAATIDAAGRPGPASAPLARFVDHMAAAIDRAGRVHLAWTTPGTPGTWTINYQSSPAASLSLNAPLALHSLTLSSDQALTTFALGLDETHGYILWGVTTARQPDAEQTRVLAFPLDAPAATSPADLQFPRHFTPGDGSKLTAPPVGRLARPAQAGEPVAVLRWPSPAPGQHRVLALALALQTPDGWRPGVAYFQAGELLGYQVIAPHPADAGPPALAFDQNGDLRLAWSALDGTAAQLYTAHTAGRGLVPDSANEQHNTALRMLAGVLVGAPVGFLWLAVPTTLLMVLPPASWRRPLAAALYAGSKLLWPAGLYTNLPPSLSALGLDSPPAAVAMTVLAIGLAAGMAGQIVHARRPHRPAWHAWLVAGLLDALLTWAVFGPAVLPT